MQKLYAAGLILDGLTHGLDEYDQVYARLFKVEPEKKTADEYRTIIGGWSPEVSESTEHEERSRLKEAEHFVDADLFNEQEICLMKHFFKNMVDVKLIVETFDEYPIYWHVRSVGIDLDSDEGHVSFIDGYNCSLPFKVEGFYRIGANNSHRFSRRVIAGERDILQDRLITEVDISPTHIPMDPKEFKCAIDGCCERPTNEATLIAWPEALGFEARDRTELYFADVMYCKNHSFKKNRKVLDTWLDEHAASLRYSAWKVFRKGI